MFAKLTGVIDSTGENFLILDVQGVGYQVFASARSLGRIGSKGASASLLIDTHVREDHIHLFGFADAEEQRWFRLLTSVQGVGAKVAMAILGACAPDRLALAIVAQDKAVLTQADGVGPKLALRILTELKDKAGKMASVPTPVAGGMPESGGMTGEAISALVNLGYSRADAYAAVGQIADPKDLQGLIRTALKRLAA